MSLKYMLLPCVLVVALATACQTTESGSVSTSESQPFGTLTVYLVTKNPGVEYTAEERTNPLIINAIEQCKKTGVMSNCETRTVIPAFSEQKLDRTVADGLWTIVRLGAVRSNFDLLIRFELYDNAGQIVTLLTAPWQTGDAALPVGSTHNFTFRFIPKNPLVWPLGKWTAKIFVNNVEAVTRSIEIVDST